MIEYLLVVILSAGSQDKYRCLNSDIAGELCIQDYIPSHEVLTIDAGGCSDGMRVTVTSSAELEDALRLLKTAKRFCAFKMKDK